MIDRTALTSSLQGEMASVVDALRHRADTVDALRQAVHGEWQAAVSAGRTAFDEDTWREGLLTQVAVAWVLGCVFVRFCEDNGLLPTPMLSGPGDRRRWATDAQVEHFRCHPEAGERAWLLHVFTEAARQPGLGEVFGPHNPVWQFGPSDAAARTLLERWRQLDAQGGLVWDFTDPAWDTRFLGDLYQDLSEHAPVVGLSGYVTARHQPSPGLWGRRALAALAVRVARCVAPARNLHGGCDRPG